MRPESGTQRKKVSSMILKGNNPRAMIMAVRQESVCQKITDSYSVTPPQLSNNVIQEVKICNDVITKTIIIKYHHRFFVITVT